MFDIGENIAAIITTGIGVIGATAIGIIKKKNDSKLDVLIDSNIRIIEAINLIKNIIELKFRNAVADSIHEITEIKELAWDKQQTDFVMKVKKIIIANHLDKKDVKIAEIESSIVESIEDTDTFLSQFNIHRFIADGDKKIKFIKSSEYPEIIYKIIMDNRSDNEKLELNIRSICQQMLQAIKREFYDNKGMVKK